MKTRPVIKALYGEWPPWAITVTEGNTTVLDGVLKDIFGALSQSLGFEFLVKPEPNGRFGSLQPDGSYSGILGALHSKEVDIGGPFVATEQRSAVVDFTSCLEFSSRGIITAVESVDRNIFLYAKVFSWKIWISLCISIIIAGLTTTLFEMFLDQCSAMNFKLLRGNIWIFFVYMLGTEGNSISKLAKKFWSRLPPRILLGAWLIGPVITIQLLFQCSMTSTFAVTRLRPVVADLDELAKKTKIIPVTTKGSATEICFRTSEKYASIWMRMKSNTIKFTPETVEDILLKVEKGTHVLIVDYVYGLGLVSQWTKRIGRCKIQVQEAEVCQSFISLGLRKGLTPELVKAINSRLNYIIQAKLTDRWLHRVFSNYTHCSKQHTDTSKALTLMDILGGFLIWIAGMAISCLAFIFELVPSRKK